MPLWREGRREADSIDAERKFPPVKIDAQRVALEQDGDGHELTMVISMMVNASSQNVRA